MFQMETAMTVDNDRKREIIARRAALEFKDGMYGKERTAYDDGSIEF